jgi:hypothetical protein
MVNMYRLRFILSSFFLRFSYVILRIRQYLVIRFPTVDDEDGIEQLLNLVIGIGGQLRDDG